jgi:hypothetical protein
MSETVKKTTTKAKAPAKPRKAATKKSTNGTVSNVTEMPMPVSYEQVASLAHQLWIESGHQHGNDADNWFRAEQMLRSKAS